MRICIITDEKDSYSSKKFHQEAAANNIKAVFASRNNFLFDSNKGKLLLNKKVPLEKFDAVILRSSATSLTPASLIVEYCEHNNIRLLNKNFYLRHQSVNKLRQQLIFQIKKTPSLRTIYGESVSLSFLKKELGLPFIAKLANGSLGKQVFKISSKKEFLQFIKKAEKEQATYLFQKFYRVDGDYRVFLIGKQIFGPLKRIAPEGQWKTNMRGSKHERAREKKQVLELAKTFLKKTNLEFAGLDILIDPHKKTRVIEINTMACFKVFDEIYPEINIAKKTIELLKKQMGFA